MEEDGGGMEEVQGKKQLNEEEKTEGNDGNTKETRRDTIKTERHVARLTNNMLEWLTEAFPTPPLTAYQ